MFKYIPGTIPVGIVGIQVPQVLGTHVPSQARSAAEVCQGLKVARSQLVSHKLKLKYPVSIPVQFEVLTTLPLSSVVR